ncbi:MAG: ABC transporter ATP-binding protein [Alphaproteobacteria bacterium]
MLEVTGLHSGYGRVPVLRGVDFEAKPGEMLVILGRNGAGKSTLLRTLAGFIKPTDGSVRLGGTNLAGLGPEDIARRGLRLVLDGHRIFPRMSVTDNLKLGGAINANATRVRQLTEEVLALFPILAEKRTSWARDLSGGQQQMLALAQAFIGDPKVLLCDEPSLGLAQALIPPIMAFLKRWAGQGAAIVIVEQQIDLALSVADRVLVMERGEIALRGTASALKDDPKLKQIYLGGA